MKFQNGEWLLREGHFLCHPEMVYEVIKEADAVTIITRPMDFASMKSATLTIRISVPAPEVIRVQAWHYMGVDESRRPSFDLNFKEGNFYSMEETDDEVRVISGKMILRINKNCWGLRFERDGELITKTGMKDLAYVKTDYKGAYYSYNSDNAYMMQKLGLSVGEQIYGFGERFTPFVKNGQNVEIWNEDGGTSTEMAYKNIPFYLSSRGYGVFVNHTERVSYEVGSESVEKVSFSVKGEYLDYMVINGPTMKEALIRYTDLTGKPGLPPEWSFGLWLSTSFITNYDEPTVLSFIDEMKERDIPLSVFHFDCLWMKMFHWTDFTWDDNVFPDPVGMIKKIHDRGVKVCVWINPYIAQCSSMFKEGKEAGYFLKHPNGDVWQWDMWQPGLAIVDVTNPAACEWYASKIKYILDMGVDCVKTDFGERIPTDVVYYDGKDPEMMHNLYSYSYNKLVYETLQKYKGEDQAVLFARAATAGSQKFPVHWGGDCTAVYESMAESLRGGLSLTSSGFGFWSHDIGGFEDTSTPDVYKRWAAFGLLSTHSRFHGSMSYRVPWNYGEEAVDTVRTFTKLKLKLMPYLYAQAVYTATVGVPMMRSMVMEFTEDLNCHYLDRQYMLGDSLLIAPIFNENSMGQFYLPEGKWTDYMTGEVFSGGRWITKTYDYLHMPIIVKENSIIPRGAVDSTAEYEYDRDVEYAIYELSGEASCDVCKKGTIKVSFTASRNGSNISVTTDNQNSFKIRLVNMPSVAADCGIVITEGNDSIICVDAGCQAINIMVS